MKLLIGLFVPLFCLKVDLLVSSQNATIAFYELVEVDKNAYGNATNDILIQYNKIISETNDELYNKLLPKLKQADQVISEYEKNLQDELKLEGHNSTRCFELVEDAFKNVSTVASVTNVTAKAIEEKEQIYDRIFYAVYAIGNKSLATLHGEIDTIGDEYFTCIISDFPQYCNRTLDTKIVAKQEEIPNIYNKQVGITRTNLIQQAFIYRNRIQDYVNELIKTRKPYLSLLEICIEEFLKLGY